MMPKWFGDEKLKFKVFDTLPHNLPRRLRRYFQKEARRVPPRLKHIRRQIAFRNRSEILSGRKKNKKGILPGLPRRWF